MTPTPERETPWWHNASAETLRLHCGEMTAAEVRTAQAVLAAAAKDYSTLQSRHVEALELLAKADDILSAHDFLGRAIGGASPGLATDTKNMLWRIRAYLAAEQKTTQS